MEGSKTDVEVIRLNQVIDGRNYHKNQEIDQIHTINMGHDEPACEPCVSTVT